MTPARPRVLCLGEAMIELTPRGADALGVSVAGDTLNAAIYLKRALGDAASVGYATAIGDDAFSDRILRAMTDEGLDVSAVRRLPGRLPGLYAIAVDGAGERSFSYWRGESAARAMLGPGGLDLAGIERPDLVLVTGITLAILPPDHRAALIAACAGWRAEGTRVAFDTNHRPRLWPDPAEARAAFDRMWAATTIALPSRDDEARLRPDESPEATLARLAAHGVREIALKDGAGGPHLWDAAGPVARPAFPPADRVVDTTAAGDGFNAGYLAARLRGAPIAEAALAGHALARRIIGHPGAILPRDGP